jgi:hypothetical protein
VWHLNFCGKKDKKMAKDSKSRKWQLTINNPKDKGLDHEHLMALLQTFKSLVYWVMSDEIGENKTYHTHIFVYFSSAVRFSSMKKKFDSAHIEMAKGSCEENRNYIFKTGKWENSKKAETNLIETHDEFGQLPLERQGQRNDIIDLYDMIKDGMSNFDILEDNPQYMLQLDKIEKVRQTVKEEKFKRVWRELDVTYIWGQTGTGKTRSVMDAYGYENVYRITDYDHPWDGYANQDVIIFEEFRSSLKIQDMLNYLDGYPLTLPCRYANKVACFTKVFIITNIDYFDQYKSVQDEHIETWLAFTRRVHHIKRIDRPTEDLNDLSGFTEISDDEQEIMRFSF